MKICFLKDEQIISRKDDLNALYTLCLGQLEEHLNAADDVVAEIRRGVYKNNGEEGKKDAVMTALNSVSSMIDLLFKNSKSFDQVSKIYPMLSLKFKNLKSKFVKVFNNLESIES